MIDGSAFANSGISAITIEEGNHRFRVSGDFLLDFEGITFIRYFGFDSNVQLDRDIEILGSGCFCHCRWLSSLGLESGSQPSRFQK
jgi:hypothetical protein